MIFLSDEELAAWGVVEDQHKFFIARWHELLDDDTFDSWQLRTCNIVSVLKEMANHIAVVDKQHRTHHHLKYLLEEAKAIIERNFLIEKRFPFLPHYIHVLESVYNDKVKRNEESETKPFSFAVDVTLGNLSGYKDVVAEELAGLLGTPGSEMLIDVLALELATLLRQEGYSLSSLRQSLDLMKGAGSFVDKFKAMVLAYKGTKLAYEVKFLIEWAKPLPDLRKFHISITSGGFASEDPKEAEFLSQDRTHVVAAITVEACDEYAARYEAEAILDSAFAAIRLYGLRGAYRIRHPKALVLKQSDGTNYLVDPDVTMLNYIKPALDPHKKMTNFADVLSQLPDIDSEQLLASLQYHKLSMQATTDEARLVNLWIAAESLVQDGGSNIIGRISKYIACSVTTGYPRLLVNALIFDLRIPWRNIDPAKILEVCPSSSPRYIAPADIFAVLVSAETSDIFQNFLRLPLMQNHLLRHKITKLRENMFGSSQIFKKAMENHLNNVTWQIHRIYRARNHIMHSGKGYPNTRHLIQHLHNYYVSTVHHLIHDLSVNHTWSIGSALEHRSILYQHTTHRLDGKKILPFSIEVFYNLTAALTDTGINPAWPVRR